MPRFIPCTVDGEKALVNLEHIACLTGRVVRLASGHCVTVTLEQAAAISQTLLEESEEPKPAKGRKP